MSQVLKGALYGGYEGCFHIPVVTGLTQRVLFSLALLLLISLHHHPPEHITYTVMIQIETVAIISYKIHLPQQEKHGCK